MGIPEGGRGDPSKHLPAAPPPPHVEGRGRACRGQDFVPEID